MPIKPKADENEQEFISRCMSEESESFPDQEQRAAVCYSYWRENMSESFVYANKESEEFATLPTTDCMERHKSAGYSEEYAKMACSKKKESDGQQGGVVAMEEEFGRTKFEYPPMAKESMNDFMARCMGDGMVREKKKDRGIRAGFCYAQYQQKYIASLARSWK